MTNLIRNPPFVEFCIISLYNVEYIGMVKKDDVCAFFFGESVGRWNWRRNY